jgi:hypothetical protein
VAGTDEPEGTKTPPEKRTGLIPAGDLPKLIAVTNGGFKKRHGDHGIAIGGEVMHPPRPDACTIVATRDGGYRVASWPALEKDAASYRYFRQTPPCLVENGVKNPDLSNEYKAKKWGGAEDGNKEIRRSAMGVSADGGILYFAIGEWVTAEWLSDALVAAGIANAAELDINYSYTRFVMYERGASGELVASSPLLSELKFTQSEYVKKPHARDFFYVKWR